MRSERVLWAFPNRHPVIERVLKAGESQRTVHWKKHTRTWDLVAHEEVSPRLLEGLDEIRAQLKSDADRVRFIRLRRTPTGRTAERSQSRFLTWDSLEGVHDHGTREIAIEIQSAAHHLAKTEGCGTSFEVQVNIEVAGKRSEPSKTFDLLDGDDDDGDGDGVDGDDPDSFETILAQKPEHLPLYFLHRMHVTCMAVLQSCLDREHGRTDKLVSLLQNQQSVGDKLVEVINPALSAAGTMMSASMEMINGVIAKERSHVAAANDLAYKRERLKTVEGIGTQVGGLALQVIMQLMGITPTMDPGAPAQPSSAGRSPPQPGPPSSPVDYDALSPVELYGRLRRVATQGQVDILTEVSAELGARFAATEPPTEEQVSEFINGLSAAMRNPANMGRFGALGHMLNPEQKAVISTILRRGA